MACKVYVGDLAWATDDPTLGAHFASIGTVKDAVVMRSEGRSRGFGFVTFSSIQEAERAIATMNDTELQGRRLRVNVAQQLRPAVEQWPSNGGGSSYMPYSPAQYHGGSGAYQSAPFAGQYTQPGFVGYPSGSGYNASGSNNGRAHSNNQPGYYQHSASAQYYPPANYGQQQQQPY